MELPALGRHPSDQPFRRFERDDGAQYGVAEDGYTTDFTMDEVGILRLDLPQFCLRVAAALDLKPASGSDDHIVDAHLVATIDRYGIPLPVYLIRTPDDDLFGAALLRVAAASRQHPSIVLTPTPRRQSVLRLLGPAAANISVLAMSELFAFFAPGALAPLRPVGPVLESALAFARGEPPLRDGVRDRQCIIHNGSTHACDLSDRELGFLQAVWGRDEIRLDEMIHPTSGLIAKARFMNTPRQRNNISRFLNPLNEKLLAAKPRIPFQYRLPKASDVVVRHVEE